MRTLIGTLGTLLPVVIGACGGASIASNSGTTSSSGGTGSAASASSSSSSASAASSTSSTSGGTGGGVAGPTITFGGTAVRVPVNAFLSSVKVCVDQHPEVECTMTDAQGAFSLLVPASAEIAVTLAKPGYASVVIPIVTSTEDQTQWEIGLPTTTSTQGFYGGFAGATYPDAKAGFLAVFLTKAGSNQAGFPGAVPSMSPPSGEGPIYAGADFTMVDPTLQATGSSGVARYANVATGIVEVKIAPGTLTCDANFGGWSAPDPSAVRVPILAGFETHVGLGCF